MKIPNLYLLHFFPFQGSKINNDFTMHQHAKKNTFGSLIGVYFALLIITNQSNHLLIQYLRRIP